MSWERRWYGRPGRLGALATPGLMLAAGLFGTGARVRQALYDAGTLRAHRVEGLRVISVGNLQVGGAGKTPVVMELSRRLLARGERVAVLSRGHGRRSAEDRHVAPGGPVPDALEIGDEPRLILRSCPGVALYVGADRVRLAQRARADGIQTVVLDDGFQHRRLARELDIVVLDGRVGLGNGHLLPWGPLREPTSALTRAHLLWVRDGGAESALPAEAAKLPRVQARHLPDRWLRADGSTVDATALRNQRVWALSGIARPSAFEDTLRSLGAELVGRDSVADHADFPAPLLARVRRDAAAQHARVVTTEKDAMRLPPDVGLDVLTLRVQLTQGEALLERLLGISPSPPSL